MDSAPTLADVLMNTQSGDALAGLFQPTPLTDHPNPYLHFSELAASTGSAREQWARLKVLRAATRTPVPEPALNLSLTPGLMLVLMEIHSPLIAPEPGTEAWQLDQSEALLQNTVAVARMTGTERPTSEIASFLRTRATPRDPDDRALQDLYQKMKTEPEPTDADLPEYLPPLLKACLLPVHRLLRDVGSSSITAALVDWLHNLSGTGLPGIESMAVCAELERNELERALEFTRNDESDATYPVMVLLRAIQSARTTWIDHAQTRQERLQSTHHPQVNLRQQLILDQAAAFGGFATSLAHHKQVFQVVYETARTDLQELAHEGLLTMTRVGRAFHFTAPAFDSPPRRDAAPRDDAPPEPRDSLPVFF